MRIRAGGGPAIQFPEERAAEFLLRSAESAVEPAAAEVNMPGAREVPEFDRQAEPAGLRERFERELRLRSNRAQSVPRDCSRDALFSFGRGESDVRNSGLGANIQDTDDVFVSAGFIASDDHSLFGVELDQAFE